LRQRSSATPVGPENRLRASDRRLGSDSAKSRQREESATTRSELRGIIITTVKFHARLFILLASEAPVGVIFRRGPSGQVLLIKWNLELDTFEHGQWLKGRVYERRCDLSPDGELLLYFAADQRRAMSSWTALSRPPYFTALTLWPKNNTYGGGGIFVSRTKLLLDRQEWEEIEIAKGFSFPDWLDIGLLGRRGGWEDFDPSSPWSLRLQRDGWKLVQFPTKTKDEFSASMRLELDPPLIWQKAHPIQADEFAIQMTILGIGGESRPAVVTEYRVVAKDGYLGHIGESEWADWARNGDLLFAQSGCLFRLRYTNGRFGPIEEGEVIADFNDLEFHRCEAPDKAKTWPEISSKPSP
jgi:hypothetical protein